MPFVDVLFGNEEDFSAALGFELEGVDEKFKDLPTASFRKMIGSVVQAYPNITTVATTLRTARSASVNGWGAICYHEGQFYEVAQTDVEIMDRVGGGDSFASGLIYGLSERQGSAVGARVRRRARSAWRCRRRVTPRWLRFPKFCER